jgi:diguanylate cyclase (GGDEF)-like protein
MGSDASDALLTLAAMILVGGSINFFIVNRRYPAPIQRGLTLYAYANLAVAAGNMLVVLFADSWPQWAQGVDLAISAVGTSLYYFAYRSIQERSFHWRMVAPLYALTLATVVFGVGIRNNINIGLLGVCGLDIIVFSLTTRDLFTNFQGRGRAHITQGGAMGLYVVVLFLWGLDLALSPPQSRLIAHLGEIESMALGTTVLGAALGAVNFLLICNDEFNSRLQMLVGTDPLTGVANRRKLMERGEVEMLRVQRFKQPLTVIMLDLDHFKRINDTFGHTVGDRVLRQSAQACVAALRDVDLVARAGGEEFAVLLPQTPLSRALEVAERLRVAIEAVHVDVMEGRVPVSASLGVTDLGDGDTAFEQLLTRADRALYRSKAGGRNRVSHEGAEADAPASVAATA